MNWRCDELIHEGLDVVISRHRSVAEQCRQGILGLGLRLYESKNGSPATTVTAVYVPDGWEWSEWYEALKRHHLYVGGSYGRLSGVVWRIGTRHRNAR